MSQKFSLNPVTPFSPTTADRLQWVHQALSLVLVVIRVMCIEPPLRRACPGEFDKCCPKFVRVFRTLVLHFVRKKSSRSVIDAVGRRDQTRMLVGGMTAANDLGMTDAVPAKIVGAYRRSAPRDQTR